MTKNNDNKNIAVATPAAEEASGAEEQRPEEEEEEEGLTGSEAFVLNVTADDALGQVDLETGVDETAVGAGSDAAAAACGSMEGNAAEDGVALAALWDTLPDHLQAKIVTEMLPEEDMAAWRRTDKRWRGAVAVVCAD
eukprot:jgi/Tetstr1/421071/TSEL_012116.t1